MTGFRKIIRRGADQLGIGSHLRQAFVEINLLGERLKYAVTGRPSPDRAIILAGSGRSGTTWLTNVLTSIPGTQQIFEPMFPPWNPEVRRLTGWDASNPHIRAWYLKPGAEYPEWHQFLYKVLTGQIRNYWTDYEKNSYFPDRYLVKMIRVSLMLGYLHDAFQPRILYMIRHPCAVVHSRLSVRPAWYADVHDILAQEQLVEDYLRPFIADIEKERDVLGAHAVWWAVENMVALRDLATRPHYFVPYESLILDPEQNAIDLMQWLNVSKIPTSLRDSLQRPNRMTRPGFGSALERASEWKRVLSTDDQQRILTWARRLGIEDYDEDVLPVHLRTTYYEPPRGVSDQPSTLVQ